MLAIIPTFIIIHSYRSNHQKQEKKNRHKHTASVNVRYAACINAMIYAWYLQRAFHTHVKSFVFPRFFIQALYQLWRTLYSFPLHHVCVCVCAPARAYIYCYTHIVCSSFSHYLRALSRARRATKRTKKAYEALCLV